MRIVYGKGFDEGERIKFLPKIGFNMMEGLKVLCQAVTDLELEGKLAEATKPLWEQLLSEPVVFASPDKEMADFVKALWSDPAIMEAWEQRSTLQVNESFSIFVQRVDQVTTRGVQGSPACAVVPSLTPPPPAAQLAAPDYVPTVEEVLLCRIRTTGITSQEYLVDGATFCMYDVGGQQNERKKWIHCFDNVNAVMFVAALSEYDQAMFEDETENRMADALQLFKWVCSQSCFEATSILLFETKVAKVNIASQPTFSDYAGKPNDLDDGIKYFTDRFLKENTNEKVRRLPRVPWNDKQHTWLIACARMNHTYLSQNHYFIHFPGDAGQLCRMITNGALHFATSLLTHEHMPLPADFLSPVASKPPEANLHARDVRQRVHGHMERRGCAKDDESRRREAAAKQW